MADQWVASRRRGKLGLNLSLLRIPLTASYKLSFVELRHVDALVVEAFDDLGHSGIGESTLQPGYTHETLDGAWDFIAKLAPGLIGRTVNEAECQVMAAGAGSPNAASALATAISALETPPLPAALRVPLLAPIHSEEDAAIPAEVESLLAQGYRTLKVKAGFDLAADLVRIAAIQRAVAGRATMRIDANGGYRRDQGVAFADALDPAGVELLEQPCAADDWDGNAAVAARSPVPVMLDESIYGLADIERAAKVTGVRLIKLKLKKIGTPALLEAALHRIGALGLTPVLGDGTGTDIAAWHETVVASRTLFNAGEMNGFLKIASPLLTAGPRFADGYLELPAGLSPALNRETVSRFTVRHSTAG